MLESRNLCLNECIVVYWYRLVWGVLLFQALFMTDYCGKIFQPTSGMKYMLVYRSLPTGQAPTNSMNILFDSVIFYVVGIMENSFGGRHITLTTALLNVIFKEK